MSTHAVGGGAPQPPPPVGAGGGGGGLAPPPQVAANGPPGPPPLGVGVLPPRMLDHLDAIKTEYEGLHAEYMVVRGQRDEYEGKINAQIQEIALVRQSLYELESQHAKLRNE